MKKSLLALFLLICGYAIAASSSCAKCSIGIKLAIAHEIKHMRRTHSNYGISQITDELVDWVNESDLSLAPDKRLKSCAVKISKDKASVTFDFFFENYGPLAIEFKTSETMKP